MLLHNSLDNVFVNQVRLPAHVVEFSGELNELAHLRDCSSLTWILMANDGFTDALGLCLRCTKALELLQSDEPALKLKGQVRRVAVFLGCADVVEEASERPSLEERIAGSFDPGWGVLCYDSMTCCSVSGRLALV